jgi:DNA-binding IscR family transcriptional regulator
MVSEDACDKVETCPARALWTKATALITDLFEHTTIADLVASGRPPHEQTG